MSKSTTSPRTNKSILAAILVGVSAYVIATVTSLPANPNVSRDAQPHGESQDDIGHDEHATGEPHEDAHVSHVVPDYYAVAPFILLLGAIAILPVIPQTTRWWESNVNRFTTAVSLAILTLAYYMFVLSEGGFSKVVHVLEHSILHEYIPFITLLFSLYTISGGIQIQGDLTAKPGTNVMFLLVGGLLASFIGTTGAAMLLIRPLIDTNNERKHLVHTVVFFIFVVCNCGGCLLPIGDPPLFLGYLEGVAFLWTMFNLWLPWAFVNFCLIGVYFLVDKFYFFPKETSKDILRDETKTRPLQILGLWPNALLLGGVVLSVALLDSKKPLPLTNWYPWPFLREAVQYSLVAASLWLGSEKIRSANRFNYHAIIEVAALFIGIFICMQPAIEILDQKGSQLGISTPRQYFWATGFLSSFLDNAPTYVVFFKTAAAGAPDFVTQVNSAGPQQAKLIGISLGSVFLGAMSYIGNGPNFMVRAIAEQMGVRMPSFFGYVLFWSLPFLIPILFLATILFL